MAINHKNFAQTTLAAAITGTTGTSITVTSESSFPAVQFIISIDTEAMLVTTVSTTTWTVTRGYEGSTAATHLNGAAIYHDISAAEADSIIPGITATAAELNVLDGITSTVTELNYTDGVTSAIQTQLDAKIAKSLMTAKGSVITASGANTPVELVVGTEGKVLTAQADGSVAWKTPAAGGLQSQLDAVRPFAAPVTTATVVVPSAIDATGTTDVTAALQAVIDGAADGSLISFPAAATYKITGALFIEHRHNLIIDGNGCTLKYTSVTGTDRAHSFWYCEDSGSVQTSDIWIRNFVFIGSSPYPGVYTPGSSPTGGEGQMGVSLTGLRFEVSNCTMSALWGDGVYVCRSTPFVTTNVWIHDNHVISAGRNGLSVISGINVLAERNTFDDVGCGSFDVEPNASTETCVNIIFRNNTIGVYGTAGYAPHAFGADNTAATVMDGIVIDNNVVTGAAIYTSIQSVSASRITRVTFTNNVGKVAAAGEILDLLHLDGLTINGNVQTVTSNVFAYIVDCTKVVGPPAEVGYLSLDNANIDLVRLITLMPEYNDGNCSGAKSLNVYSYGMAHRCTLTGNVTFTFLYPPANPCFYLLKLIQDGTGGRTVTWPATVKGTPAINPAISATSAVLFYWDGTNYWTLNGLLAGQTATVAELNVLDGITATTAELNALDGITSTVTELNYTDGVTSGIQAQFIAKAPLAPVAATYTPATGAQTVALDVTTVNMHVVSGHASGTAITFTVTGATNNQPFVVSILQGGTTVSTIAAWFATVRWAGGTAPTLTATLNKRDTFGFIRTGANTYDGFVIGQNA